MEVKLHHHALPVVLTMAALFVLSFIVLTSASSNLQNATQALLTRQPDRKEPAAPDTSQAGSHAQLIFSLQ